MQLGPTELTQWQNRKKKHTYAPKPFLKSNQTFITIIAKNCVCVDSYMVTYPTVLNIVAEVPTA